MKLLASLSIAIVTCSAASATGGDVSLVEKLDILQRSYPAAIRKIRGNTLVLKSGRELLIDDGQKKTHQHKLQSADIEDTLSQVYPVETCDRGKPARNADPGRIRNDNLMRALYGGNRSAVRDDLKTIKWFGNRLSVTHRHGVASALERVRNDLVKLPAKFRKFFEKSGGTFNWRAIAGTKRLSVHSFGAAIDINTKYTDYWRWAGGKPGKVPQYKNKIPNEIVEIFERHGFIWGGKWYHFDTMHFEYRPELIEIGKLAAKRGCAH